MLFQIIILLVALTFEWNHKTREEGLHDEMMVQCLNYFLFAGVTHLEFLGINSNLVFFFPCPIFLPTVRAQKNSLLSVE